MNLVAVGFFFLGMAALLVLVFVAVRYLDEIEELLSKSVYVSGNKKLYAPAGVIGKIMRICTISTVLTMPGVFARRRLVDVDQLRDFPNSIKGFWSGHGAQCLSLLWSSCFSVLFRRAVII